jgi:hypothetical protein
MANSKLLKEAIADAKAVKETALANAKIALEEAFTPRLQSILSKKLREEMEDADEKEAEVANEELSSSTIGTGTGKAPKAPKALQADTDLSVGVKKSSKAAGAEGEEKKVADINEMEGEEEAPEMEKDENLSVSQLREKLLARLAELDGEEETEEPAEAPAMGEDDEEETPEMPAMGEDDEEETPEMPPMGEDDEEGEDYDVTGEEEEDTEEDEDGLDLESIIRELEASVDAEEAPEEEPVAEDKLSSGDPAGTDKGEDPKVVMAEEEEEKKDDEEVVDLEEILREMEADLKGDEEEKEDMDEVKKQLKEAYSTIESLRSTINEVNLLNAKLLFANKLFRAHNLTNEQKVKVIETLDRTKSVREVKLVYSTLAENLRFGSSQKVAKKSITEGMASKVVKSTKPAAKQVIAEGADFSARFKKLAGIIK